MNIRKKYFFISSSASCRSAARQLVAVSCATLPFPAGRPRARASRRRGSRSWPVYKCDVGLLFHVYSLKFDRVNVFFLYSSILSVLFCSRARASRRRGSRSWPSSMTGWRPALAGQAGGRWRPRTTRCARVAHAKWNTSSAALSAPRVAGDHGCGDVQKTRGVWRLQAGCWFV